MGATCFTQLTVWQKAHQLSLAVYKFTERFPATQRFGLVSQMQRAALSIPANIAEGFGRRRPRDKARFYNIAEASADELKHYLIVAKDLGFLPDIARPASLLDEVRRMLRKLTDLTERWADLGDRPVS